MIKISKEKVLLLQQLMIAETGGSAGVRDFNLLDAALECAFITFDKKELYPSKEEKAAKIGYELIANHAFVDGNKRIGMYIMLTFLEVNGISLKLEDQDIINVGLAVASGKMSYDDVLEWIKEHE